jgi:hypothetical protein
MVPTLYMADLNEIDRAEAVKIAGANPSTGVTDNYMEVDVNGNAKVIDSADGPVTPGAVASNSNLIGGQFNSTLPTLTTTQQSAIQLDSSGRLLTSTIIIPSVTSTYTAGAINLIVAASATDVFTITGSATKTVRVLKVGISGTQTTSSNINAQLVKRSTANTGGTSTLQSGPAFDSTNPASTATVRAYTANPTLGTSLGNFQGIKLWVPSTSGDGASGQWIWEFTENSSQTIVLRGINEVLSINLTGATITGNNFDIWVNWSEE